MKNDDKGIVIVSVLMVTIILLILTTSLLVINYTNLGFTNIMERQVAARKVAEAGVAYAVCALNKNSQWGRSGEKVTIQVPEVSGKFTITFDNSDPYYSVNNLVDPTKPGAAYGGTGVPGFSIDLIVTGSVNQGGNETVKRLRVILQRDVYYDAALASGQIDVTASNLDISNEDPNSSGTLHSNSVKTLTDPDGAAVKSDSSTNITLHGGTVSAQGDIDISSSQIDVNSTIQPNSQGRHIKPIDINQMISNADTSGCKHIGSGGSNITYVVDANSVSSYINNDPGTKATVGLGDGLEVVNGKLYMTDDIVFAGTKVRFEFDHAAIGSTNAKDAGIYLGDPYDASATEPSIYVNGGNLEVAGAIKGNGSFYVSGSASYVGESNLVASSDPGVAVMCNDDLNLSLPSVTGKALDLNMTGLIYTHGNADISVLDPIDATNPVNNFVGGQWPSDWEDTYLGGGGTSGSLNEIEFTGASDFKISGTDSSTIIKSGSTYELNTNGGTISISYGSPSKTFTADSSISKISISFSGITTTPPATIPFTFDDAFNMAALLQGAEVTEDPDNPGSKLLELPFDFSEAGSTGSGTKMDPNFHITGALVAIDPNNPCPTVSKPEDPDSGNIKIDVKTGKVAVNCSSKYLKLLEVAKSTLAFRMAAWCDI